METLDDQVVVVTGGASGIGLALAQAFAAEGGRVVIADIEQAALAGAAGQLPEGTLAVRTDVADLASVEALRDAVLERHGRVDVLCNNAGVSTFNAIAEQTIDDWRWVLGVNLWGVIHGVHTFLPVMRSQGTPAHIVSTASEAGLASGLPFLGPYSVSKVGVVSISETLRLELAASPIGVSVLCPGSTNTRVLESERNRRADQGIERRTDEGEAMRLAIEATLVRADGKDAGAVAADVVSAVLEDRFWVVPHGDLGPMFRARFDEIVASLPA